jgi:ankyrin repeat protein
LEAHVSNYRDDMNLRANKINETDVWNGRNALHYLSYIGNTDLIQLLAATDQMKMNIIDAYDRNCMHYAVINGKSTLINTLFLLFKQYGGKFERCPVDASKAEKKLNL